MNYVKLRNDIRRHIEVQNEAARNNWGYVDTMDRIHARRNRLRNILERIETTRNLPDFS